MEYSLDLELARRLQVGAGTAAFRDDQPTFISEQAHGFGAARVDAEHMHTRQILC